jgi:hypothetical protein
VYIWLFEAGQDSAEVAGAVDRGAEDVADDVDDALKTADEALLPDETLLPDATLLPDDPPGTRIAEIVLLPDDV